MSISHPLVCLGHALLDISAPVKLEYLEKYGLAPGKILLADDEHLPIYKDLVDHYECEFIAGGSAQNTCRAAQWLSQTPGFTGFFGCVGEDEYSTRLREATNKGGVSVYYLVDPSTPTGTCAVLIHEKERTLVANLSAAKNLTLDYVQTNWNVIENSTAVYAEGFLLSNAASILKETFKHVSELGKITAINISAQYIIEFFKDNLSEVLLYSEYVFGNEDEAQKFGEVFGLAGDIFEVTKQISTIESRTSRPRKVIITRGKESTLYAESGNLLQFEVPLIPHDKVLDLNGAGDSFVGGFLTEAIKGSSVERSMAAGHYLSGEVIQLSGCSFPPEPSFK